MAEGLARPGARVVLNGRNRAKLEAAAQRLVADGHAATICAFDVTDEAAVNAGSRKPKRDRAHRHPGQQRGVQPSQAAAGILVCRMARVAGSQSRRPFL
jgi:NAD(P)-dependent dehydrogenase (short-subunit alcohol dehydrogenase family)